MKTIEVHSILYDKGKNTYILMFKSSAEICFHLYITEEQALHLIRNDVEIYCVQDIMQEKTDWQITKEKIVTRFDMNWKKMSMSNRKIVLKQLKDCVKD